MRYTKRQRQHGYANEIPSKGMSSRDPVLESRGSSYISPRRGISPGLLPTINTGLDIAGLSRKGRTLGLNVGLRSGGRCIGSFFCLLTVKIQLRRLCVGLGEFWCQEMVTG